MADGVYRMWWCGQTPGGKPGDDILYAESASLNGPFHARGSSAPYQRVFDGTGTGSFDSTHTCDPSVVRVGGIDYLCYGAERATGEPTTMGVASSRDGIHWTRLNHGRPIVTPAKQQQTPNTYGAGQPSVVYLNGDFYLMFTDTTGAGALGNGAGKFVWRSPDLTFQSRVQVFTSSGWRAKTGANSRSFSVANAFSADWQYSDALRSFVIARDNTPGQATLSFHAPSNLATHPYGEVAVPGQWSEGPGIVSRPDKHGVVSANNDCGRVPVDVIHASTGRPPQQLTHVGLDLLSGKSCASMPASQLAAMYEGYGLQTSRLPAAVVVGGRRLQIQSASVYTDMTRNRINVPSSIYHAIPYGASLHKGATVLGAPGLAGAFELDHKKLWPVNSQRLVPDGPHHVAVAPPGARFDLPLLASSCMVIASGKLGLPENAAVAFALGADMINVAREAMLSIGCIQAQKCHTDKCPTGIATQSPWLARGLDPTSKATRAAVYLRTLRKELMKVSAAVGVAHPALITATDIEIMNGDYEARTLAGVYGYKDGWGELGPHLAEEITALLTTEQPSDQKPTA
ncbi:glutamate synthase-related protein [Streptomyces platensis]|uniref:glutamate synthase-related protein n=1 Tax=Streptomyces platensis TaxID=58346 RepID=UPI0033F78512